MVFVVFAVLAVCPGTFRTPCAVLVGSNGTNLTAGLTRLLGVGSSQTSAEKWIGSLGKKKNTFQMGFLNLEVFKVHIFKVFKKKLQLFNYFQVFNQKVQKVNKVTRNHAKCQPFRLPSDTHHTVFHLPCLE